MVIRSLRSGFAGLPGIMWERLSPGRCLDFIGLNYYTRDFVRNAGFDLAGLLGSGATKDHHLSIASRNVLGWEVYPEGLEQILVEYRQYRLPILVSENGICTPRDASRWPFIHMHLWHVARALSRDVRVFGYLYWSLLDNFEWAEGYKARFGLVEVDYATQQRRIRPSALHLRDLIRRNRF
jgi:beta-glucosidase